MKKFAFNLSEMLIVIAVIGVIAAIILPSVIQNLGERINSHRHANIAQKITKSVELMIVNGDYSEISTTEEFVNKLSKYLKIAKICDFEHLTDCWPTRKIKTVKGEMYNISDAITGSDLHTKGSGNNVGLVLADGASIILTFNTNAMAILAESGFIPYRKSLPVGFGKTEDFAYSSNATSAIDFVMDVNGKTGPNQESDYINKNYYDIRSFRIAAFDGCPGTYIDSVGCIIHIGTYNWNNGIKACENYDMEMVSLSIFQNIYSKINNYPDLEFQEILWTSTPQSDNNGRAWRFWGKSGGTATDYKSSSYPVWCIKKEL